MANYWNIEGVPHKGWEYETIIDLREEGEEYESCMMCGKEEIRYVHVLSHDEVADVFRVGCVCAEKMTGDYVNPKRREQEIQNKARRRSNWANKDWKFSKHGNPYLKLDGKLIVIYQDKKSKKFKITIDGIFGKHSFDNLGNAKIAAFNGVEFLKNKGDW